MRNDLAPGLQIAQACHALRQFSEEHPDIDRVWFKESNYIVCLSVKNEEKLDTLIDKAYVNGIKLSKFRESDLENQITAIAIEPGNKAKKLCSHLPLALK